MICAGASNYEFSRPLKRLEDLDTLLLKIGWRDHCNYVEEDIWVFLEEKRALILDCSVELLSMRLWNTIPQLGLSPVTVVYRRQHHVFKVPAKRGKLHANIDPRDIDSRHLLARWKLKQTVGLILEVDEVPGMLGILELVGI